LLGCYVGGVLGVHGVVDGGWCGWFNGVYVVHGFRIIVNRELLDAPLEIDERKSHRLLLHIRVRWWLLKKRSCVPWFGCAIILYYATTTLQKGMQDYKNARA